MAFAKFAFIAEFSFLQPANLSIRKNTEEYPLWVQKRPFRHSLAKGRLFWGKADAS
jgi:hypothetical protein